MRGASLSLLLLIATLAGAAEQKPVPDFIPLSELETARLETIRLQVQIVQRDIQTLARRAAESQKIDAAQYDFNFERGGFVKKGTPAAQAVPQRPTDLPASPQP